MLSPEEYAEAHIDGAINIPLKRIDRRSAGALDRTLPVIIMTGLATPGELAQARQLGVTEIVEKPEVLKRFGDALARIARRDRSQDAT